MKSIPGLLFFLLVLSPLARAFNAQGKIKALLDHSPFANQAPPLTSVSKDSLEFRAVLEERHRLIFSLFEITKHHSAWLELNEPVNGITASEYDDATQSLKVQYQGKTMTLTLKGAAMRDKIVSTMPPPVDLAATETESVYHDEPFRIGHVAEEIEIRSVLRQPTMPPAERAETLTP